MTDRIERIQKTHCHHSAEISNLIILNMINQKFMYFKINLFQLWAIICGTTVKINKIWIKISKL